MGTYTNDGSGSQWFPKGFVMGTYTNDVYGSHRTRCTCSSHSVGRFVHQCCTSSLKLVDSLDATCASSGFSIITNTVFPYSEYSCSLIYPKYASK